MFLLFVCAVFPTPCLCKPSVEIRFIKITPWVVLLSSTNRGDLERRQCLKILHGAVNEQKQWRRLCIEPFRVVSECNTWLSIPETSKFAHIVTVLAHTLNGSLVPFHLVPIPVTARSKAASLLGLWVLIPSAAGMFASCDCRVLSERGVCVGLITCPE